MNSQFSFSFVFDVFIDDITNTLHTAAVLDDKVMMNKGGDMTELVPLLDAG